MYGEKYINVKTMNNSNYFVINGEPIVLYRVGDPYTIGGFWATDPEYARIILGDYREHNRAYVLGNAKIYWSDNDANKQEIREAKEYGYDIIVFPMWDYDDDEWVVLNPNILVFI